MVPSVGFEPTSLILWAAHFECAVFATFTTRGGEYLVSTSVHYLPWYICDVQGYKQTDIHRGGNINWLTDCLDCQLSMSRVNGDVRGDSPTPHFDLFTQILSERLIVVLTSIGTEPCVLAPEVLSVLMSHLLGWTDSDDQCSHRERTQIGFAEHVEKRNSSRHVSRSFHLVSSRSSQQRSRQWAQRAQLRRRR